VARSGIEAAMHRRTLVLALPALAFVTHAADVAEDAGPAGHRVSTAQLQRLLTQRFPLRYPVPGLLNLDLQTPQLTMLPEQNRLRAAMPVVAAGPALHQAHQGSFDLDFALRYEASDRSVRAHRLRLGRLRFPTLQAPVVALLDTYAPALAEQALGEVVLHQLQPQDLKAIDAIGMQPGAVTVTKDGLVIGLVPKPL
jgi:hypothetical protein